MLGHNRKMTHPAAHCSHSGSHFGRVFNDRPPQSALRPAINGAAMKLAPEAG